MTARVPYSQPYRSPLYSPLAKGGGGFRIEDLFLPGNTGFYFDFARTQDTFQDIAGTVPADDDGEAVALIIGRVNGLNATQSSSPARPARKAGGFIRPDGFDDALTTTWVPPLSGASIALKLKPVKTGSLTIPMGGSTTGSGNGSRFFLAMDTGGQICGAAGILSFTALRGSADVSGTVGVAVLTASEGVARLYYNGALVSSAGYALGNFGPSPIWMGAGAGSGAGSGFAPSDIYKSLGISRALTATEVLNLSTNWSASP